MSNTLLLQYTGDRIDGTEAHRLGVVSKVLPDGDLMESSMELAGRLAKGPTQSLALIKYLVHRSLEMDFEDSLDLAHVAQEQVRKTEDHKEAVQAFLEKRPPNFQGR
jgi:2-(1,2-epoxy-1,2-dihydrophenyl)acetyl-CoA isomerase